jgi:uncharacterized protein
LRPNMPSPYTMDMFSLSMSNKKLAMMAIVFGVIVFAGTMFYYMKNPLGLKLQIRSHEFRVDLAISAEDHIKGLSGKTDMPKDRGMLFIFDTKQQYSFWMKDMNFPLDIIWIDDKTIVDISKNVPVEASYPPPTYTPNKSVNRVLEINAGLSDAYGFQIGDSVTYLKR